MESLPRRGVGEGSLIYPPTLPFVRAGTSQRRPPEAEPKPGCNGKPGRGLPASQGWGLHEGLALLPECSQDPQQQLTLPMQGPAPPHELPGPSQQVHGAGTAVSLLNTRGLKKACEMELKDKWH